MTVPRKWLPPSILGCYVPHARTTSIAKTENLPDDGVNVTSEDDVVPISESVKRLGIPAPRPAVILVVDDDISVLIAARRILTMYGYSVLEAAGGDEALQLARENAHRIDVVLTGVRMPGLDGPSLVARLADVLPALRVVYMSGYTDGPLAVELPASGHAFLSKPLTVEQLTRTLAAVLG